MRRVGLGLGLTVAHYVIGLAAVLAFNNTRAIGAILLTFLFPLGIVASYINPHRMALAAIANSVCCGFVAAYGLSIWLNRKV